MTIKQRIYALALVLLGVLAGSPAYAEASISDRLDELERDTDLSGLTAALNGFSTNSEMKQALTWLRKKFVKLDGGSRIAFLYATTLDRGGVNDTATFAYVVARLVARVDAARCSDDKLALLRIAQWEEGLQHLEKRYKAMEISEAVYISEMAISWEDKNRLRKADPWLCKKRLEKQPDSEISAKRKSENNKEVRIVSKPFAKGKMLIVEDKDSKPFYVTKDTWIMRRKQVLSEFNAKIRR